MTFVPVLPQEIHKIKLISVQVSPNLAASQSAKQNLVPSNSFPALAVLAVLQSGLPISLSDYRMSVLLQGTFILIRNQISLICLVCSCSEIDLGAF